MLDEIRLQNELLREIEEEKGFSWRKVMRIVELYAINSELK